ncbi:MAG: Hemolysin-type calcium-binding region [Nocardioides sp.]|nr:Hemolysin-type calcium-binding region [Nocardioides sp.]
MCQGKRATLVGDSPNRTVRGTPGNDVIIVKSGRGVDAGRGADIICVRGSYSIDAGPGHDSVVNESGRTIEVTLGTGADRFRGGSASEQVSALVDGELGDDIDTGAGGDVVRIAPNARRGSVVVGGPGRDTLYGSGSRAFKKGVRLDNARHRITVGRTTTGRLLGFEEYYLSGGISFTGGPQAEHVITQGTVGDVDMGNGNDRISVQPYYLNVRGALRGGGDVDELLLSSEYEAVGPIRADFAKGSVTIKAVTPDSPTQRDETFAVGGWNTIRIHYFTVAVVGRADDEAFDIEACRGTVNGGRGDDDIQLTALRNVPDAGGDIACGGDNEVTVAGGAGDDALGGGELRDVLVGGEGTDFADGGDGIDECEAETTVRCE